MQTLKNLMEDTVLEKIDSLWPQTNYCMCDRCRLDIACYSLNHLPTRYVTTNAGAVLHKFDSLTTQSDAEITACVYRAIQMVGECPNHEVFESSNTDSDQKNQKNKKNACILLEYVV